jgi:hypothetical protein
MSFPTTLPSYTITSGSETANGTGGGTGLSGLLNALEVDVTALGTKLGTGASTPVANQVLIGNGTGTSTWSGLTSSQLASILSDETGSGLVVFNSSPTIVTPTIASFTNATHNHTNAAGGGNITTGAFTQGAVGAADIATTAITLASLSSVTSPGAFTSTNILIPGLTTTVTIPAGGRKVRITAFVPNIGSSSACNATIAIYNNTAASGTILQQAAYQTNSTSSAVTTGYIIYEYTPAAGSQSYCVAVSVGAGNGTVTLGANTIAYMSIQVL